MQQISQRLLWTQQWLNGVKETWTPSTESGNPSYDTQSPAARAASATDLHTPAAGTNTGFELVSRKKKKANNNNNNTNDVSTNFGVISIPDSQPPIQDLEDLPPLPSSHCSSCGWPFPPAPPSEPEDPTPPDQLAQNLELAGRGDYRHAFGDLRSPSLARRRDRSAREKYYGFRYVKRGELDVDEEECHVEEEGREKQNDIDHDVDEDNKSEEVSSRVGTTSDRGTERPAHPSTKETHHHTTFSPSSSSPSPAEELDKHALYRLAQQYPRPPKNHHRHIDKIIAPLSQRVDKRREERKHQKSILRDELEEV